jgi:hypothetical protein
MYSVRRWVVRHSRGFEFIYNAFEPVIAWLDPVWRGIGYARVERSVTAVERAVKGFLFDCKMCGQCALSSTGMSCPMNCPKNLRNGPCGGVRANGHCEVKTEMKCVWAEAWAGSQHMKSGGKIQIVQKPVDFRLRDTSSWLRVARQIAEQRAAVKGEHR